MIKIWIKFEQDNVLDLVQIQIFSSGLQNLNQMSSHSQFKRFNILQQLEQAIKKKTHQKYKSKSKSKPIELKPARTPVLEKQSVGVTVTRKSNQGVIQPPPPTVKSKQIDFKVKKYQNKKFDKIVSLINYTITSADKALKYVSLSSNFEAEFAFKLYLSDRQNLMNELNSLSLQQIISSMNPMSTVMQPVEMKALQSNQNSNIEIHSLKNQNDKLKKQIMIMEGEIKKYKHREHEHKSNTSSPVMGKVDLQKEDLLKRQIDVKQIQVNKLSDLLKRLCNFNEVYDYLDLVDKEMKYRSALASAGLSGFELNKIQREEFERNLVSLDGRIGELEGMMIAKMEKMAEGQDEEVLQELEAINKLLHRKIAPILKENQSQSLENKKISEITSMYVNYSVKRERELSASLEKMEGKLIDYIQMAKDFEKKDMSTEQKFDQLYKENQLVKTNLKDIYEELKALLTDSLRKSGISESSDVTFETLLKQIEITLMKNAQLRGMEKKVKELLEEENRKSALIMKQNSIIQNMEYQLNQMKLHLKDSQDRKKQVQEYVLLLQKKKKQESKQYEQVRSRFQNFAKQMQQSEALLYEKQTIIKRLQQQMQYTKVDIHKLSSLIRSKEQQIQQRQDIIHDKQVRIEKIVAENSIHREEAIEIKGRLDQEIHEKNRILEHMRFLEDRLKEAENHIEGISEESGEKVKELDRELRNMTNSLKQANSQRERFETMYQNLLQTRESQDQRKMGNLKHIQQQIQQLRDQNHSYKQQITTLSHQLTSITSKSQSQQQALLQSHELQKQQLINTLNQMKQEIQQLREVSEKVHESNHVQLMQQNISSQEDILEEINHKEEQIIELKRTIQELEGELEDRQGDMHEKERAIEQLEGESEAKLNVIIQLQTKIETYIVRNQQLQANLQSALRQSHQTKSKNTLLQKKLLELQSYLVDKSPLQSHNDSLAYQQQLRIQQIEQKLNQTITQFHIKQQQANILKNQLSSKQSQFLQLQMKMTQIEGIFIEKEVQLENRQTQLQQKATQLEDKENQLQEKFNQLEERFSHLQERETVFETKQEQLQAKYTELQTKIRHYQEKQSQFQVISSEHNTKTHQLSVKEQQLSDRHTQIQERQSLLEQKQQSLQEKQQELDSRLSQLQERHSKLEEKQSQLEHRQAQIENRHSGIANLNQNKEPQQEGEQQQENEEKQNYQQKSKQLQSLAQRYNQQLQQRDHQLQQNHIQLQQNHQQITHLNQQLLILTDALTTQTTAAQSLSFHITTNQKTIQQLQLKLEILEVTHEEKDLQIQSLSQKVEELYVEIVDLKKKSECKIEFREQRSDDFMMGVESSTKRDKLNDSPIDDLQGVSPKKGRLMKARKQQADEQNQEEQQQPKQFDQEQDQSPVQHLQNQPQVDQAHPSEQGQQSELLKGQQSDLLKEGSNSKSQRKSDNWLSADEVQKRIQSQVRQVAKRQSQQVEQYPGSTIEIIQTKYKRLITDLKSQVEQKEQNISHVRQSHELLENQNSELIGHIQLIERVKLELENELVGLREIARQRMDENDRLNDQIIRIKEEAEDNTKRLVKQIEEYEELHLAPLRLKLQENDQEINQLNDKYQQLQTTLHQTKRTKQEYIQALQNQSSMKQQQFHTKLQQLRTSIDQSTLNLMKYQQQNQNMASQNYELKQKLQAKQNQSKESNSKALVSLQTQLNILREENELILTRSSTSELRVELKIRQLRSQVIRLTTEVRMKEDQVQSLKKQLEEQQNLQQNFKSQSSSILVKNNQQIDYLNKELEQANDKLLRNSIMFQQAQRKIVLLQQQLTITTASTTQKNTQINQLHSTIEQLKYTNHSLTQTVSELNSELQKKQLQIQHLKISQQIQTYQSYSSPNRNYSSQQREYKQKQLEQQEEQDSGKGNNLEEFDDMKSEKMNESMMSNEPEVQAVVKRVNEEKQVRFEDLLAKNSPTQQYHHEAHATHQEQSLTTHTYTHHTQTHYTKIQTYETIKQTSYHQFIHQSHRGEQVQHFQQVSIGAQEKGQMMKQKEDKFFDYFDDMNDEKMNASMVSNDATQQRGEYYQKQAIIVEKQYLTENVQETLQQRVQSPSKQQQHQEQDQQQNNQKQTEEQYFDEFNDIKSQKMNQSMMSNQPQPTEHREIFTGLKQVTHHQNIVSLHEDREHSQGQVEKGAQDKQAEGGQGQQKPHFKSQEDIHVQLNQQHEVQDKQEEGQDFDEFNDMKSEKMNESMMSNDPQSTEQQDNPIEKDTPQQKTQQAKQPQPQNQVMRQQQLQQQQQLEQQQEEQPEQQQEQPDLDEFNDMASQKMNQSMMSNQPEPTETQPIAQPVTIEQHHNIVDAHEDHQHSQGSSVQKYEINNNYKDIDIEPDQQQQQQTHSENVPYHHEQLNSAQRQQQKQKKQQEQQDFDEFNDMKSEKMNESMMSNEPEPSEHPDYVYHQVEEEHRNIVKANEDVEHSEGQHVDTVQIYSAYEVEQEEREHPKSVQQVVIARTEIVNQDNQVVESHQHEQIHQQQEPEEDQQENQQNENGQKDDEPDFDQFNDMKSQKINQSMMSNQPQPTQNQKSQHEQQLSSHQVNDKPSPFTNLVSTQTNRTPRSQYNYHHSQQVSQVVIHKALGVPQIPEDSDINNFNQIAQDRMNQSMMSNEPQVSDKMKNMNQPSDDEEDEEAIVQNKIFEHNIVTVSRTSQLNKKQQASNYFHDGLSQRGNLQTNNNNDSQQQQQDTVQVQNQNKKKSIIETHHNHYRSQYEFGNSPFGESRDEEGLEMLRKAGRTKEFSGSVASNQVEVNDVGGNFINEYVLNEGRNNIVERNVVVMSHHHLEQRSERYLESGGKREGDYYQQGGDQYEQNTIEQHHKAHHSSSRSQYAYNHLSGAHITKATSERRQQSDSMVEDRDEQDEEKDYEVMEQPLQAVQQVEQIEKKQQEQEEQGQEEGEQGKQSQEQADNKGESSLESDADQEQYQQLNGATHHHLSQQLLQQPQNLSPQPQQQPQPHVQPTQTHHNQQQDYQEEQQEYNQQQMEDYQPEGLNSSRLQKEANELEDQEDDSGNQNYRGRNSLPLYTQENFTITEMDNLKNSKQSIQHQQLEKEEQRQQGEEGLQEQQQIQANQYRTEHIHIEQIHIEQIQTQLTQLQHQQATQEQVQASHHAVHAYYQEVTTKVQTTVTSYYQKHVQSVENTLLLNQNNSININHYVSTSSNFNTYSLQQEHYQEDNQVGLQRKEVLMTGDRQALLREQNDGEQEDEQKSEENDEQQQQREEEEELQQYLKDQYKKQIEQQEVRVEKRVVEGYIQQITYTITTAQQENYEQTVTTQIHTLTPSPQQVYTLKQQQKQHQYEEKQYEQLEEEQAQYDQFDNNRKQQQNQEQVQWQQTQELEQNDQQQEHKEEEQQQVNEDNNEQNNFSDFNEMKSQPMNASMISNDEQLNPTYQVNQHDQQANQPHQLHDSKHENYKYQEQTDQHNNQVDNNNDQHQEIEQQQLQQQPNQQEQQGNDFDAFNDMASQKMNASMISNNDQTNLNSQALQQQQQLQQTPKQQTQQLEKYEKQQEDQQHNKEEQHKKEEEEGDELDAFNDMASEKMDASMMSNYNNQNQVPEPLQQPHMAEEEKLQQEPQQVPQQVDENNFSNFNDMPSQNMGDSMISNQDQQPQLLGQNQPLTQLLGNSSYKQQTFQQTVTQTVQQTVVTQSVQKEVNLDELQENKSQNQQDQGNFSNFMEMPNEQMSASMISNHQQEQAHTIQTQQVTVQITQTITKVVESHQIQTHNQPEPTQDQFDQNNFSDFNDMASQKMGNSMISNNNDNIETQFEKAPQQEDKNISPIKEKSPEKHQVEQGNDFDAFNSMVEQKMDGSMVSNNQDKNIDWFDKNSQQNQQTEEQGFSDFKDYNSEHMSQSQVSAQGQQIKPANFQPQVNQLMLNNLAQKEQNLQDLLGMEKVLPSDILLTSERKYQAHYETNHDDEEEDFNALINFLPQSEQKKKKTQGQHQATQEEGMDTNRSNSFNQDDFEFKVRKSVESIGSRADIFENFQNPTGSKISSEGSDFKSSEMIKSAKRIENIKGKANDLFGFEDIMEQEHESSQHSSTYQRQNDDDFGDFLSKGNEPAPSPVNKRNEANDFFDFDKVAEESGSKSSPKKFNPFEDFE